jgi:hypothetical protein
MMRTPAIRGCHWLATVNGHGGRGLLVFCVVKLDVWGGIGVLAPVGVP